MSVGEAGSDRTFDVVADQVAGVPFMSPQQGRTMFDHVRASGARTALELGTAHGVGAAYIAAALPTDGSLVTVDQREATYDPAPDVVLRRAGVRDRVTLERQYSSYTWWLKEQVARRSDNAGNCAPMFDFIYLDGAKNWTIDGLAVVLAEKLLVPGGWLLMDDLGWRYDDQPGRDVSDGVTVRALSDAERTEPHLRAVFDLIVAQHPSFTELHVQDGWWGWARKLPEAPRTMTVSESRSVSATVMSTARSGGRALRRQVRRVSRRG